MLSLRIVLGEVKPDLRPSLWLKRNTEMDTKLESKIRETIKKANQFLRNEKVKTSPFFDFCSEIIVRLLTVYVEPERYMFPLLSLKPEIQACLHRRPLSKLHRQTNCMTRALYYFEEIFLLRL